MRGVVEVPKLRWGDLGEDGKRYTYISGEHSSRVRGLEEGYGLEVSRVL